MINIKEKVLSLKDRYGCAEPEQLCEKMGINIVDHELPDNINGFTVSMEGIPFIVLNSALNYYDRRITMSHELGHIVLHGSTNTVCLSLNTSFCLSKFEREADCFAACLLMEAGLEEIDGMDCVTAEDIAKRAHIPQEMVENAFSRWSEI